MKVYLKKYYGEILYSSSSLLVPIIGFLANIIATAYITPINMGIYQSVLIFLTYFNFLHLGVFQGLNRNISYYKSQNRLDIVQNQVNTSNSVAYVISLVGLIVGLAMFFYIYYVGKGFYYLLATILLTISLVVTPIKTHIEATFRSSEQFGVLGKIIFKENIIYGFFSILPIFIGYYGKIISDTVRALISFYFRIKKCILQSNGKGDYKSLFELIKVGFPILITGYLWSLFVIADQTLIALKFSKFDLGIYTLSRLIITALIIIPNAIGVILYPRLSAEYGKTGKISSLRIFWRKSITITAIIIVPLVILMYFTITFVVINFMPNYIDGLPSAKINLLTGITFIFMAPGVIFGIINKNTPYLIAIATTLLIFWLGCFIFPFYFKTLNSVAYFKLILSLTLSIFIFLYTYYLTSKKYYKKSL